MDQQIIRNLFSHSRLLDSTAKPKQFLDMACRVVGPPFSHSSRHASVKRLGADLHAAATFVQVGARADDISMPLLGCPIVQIRPPANALGLQVAHFTGHPICPPARSSSTSRLPSSSGCTSTGRPQADSLGVGPVIGGSYDCPSPHGRRAVITRWPAFFERFHESRPCWRPKRAPC